MDQIEHLHEALIEAVKACGGTKRVAALLWPAKAAQNLEAARRHLANCLNPECAEKLSLEELMLVVRTAREAGDHTVMRFLAEALSYAEPEPVAIDDQVDELQRRFVAATAQLSTLADQMQALQRRARRAA